MRSRSMFNLHTAMALLLTLLGGCSAAPPATRYLLPQALVVPPTGVPGNESVPAVRLAQVRLPSYLGDAAIAYQRADGTVVISPEQQWAEDPEQAVTHALGAALRQASGATIIHEPWQPGLESAATIMVSIHRLLGTPGEQTRLAGQYLLVSPDGRLRVRDFDLRVPVEGTDTPALLLSYARALASLAEQIAGALRE